MIFADEMFSAFNKLYNEYCKKQKCYYVKRLFVRKERLLNSPFALVVCFVKIILLLFIFSLPQVFIFIQYIDFTAPSLS